MHRNQYLIDMCIMEGCTVLDDSCVKCGTPEDWESAMANQLWSNERLEAMVEETSWETHDSEGRSHDVMNVDDVENYLYQMRDDYEQRIAELEAENARLRALLPDEITRQAICDLAENDEVDRTLQGEVDETLRGIDYYRPEIIFHWLDKLEQFKGGNDG